LESKHNLRTPFRLEKVQKARIPVHSELRDETNINHLSKKNQRIIGIEGDGLERLVRGWAIRDLRTMQLKRNCFVSGLSGSDATGAKRFQSSTASTLSHFTRDERGGKTKTSSRVAHQAGENSTG